VAGDDEGVKPVCLLPDPKHSSTTLICCEYITLTGTVAALGSGNDPGSTDWWPAEFSGGRQRPILTVYLSDWRQCAPVIVDSCGFTEPETDLLSAQDLLEVGTPVADLNWLRLSAWQELTAEAFDPPQRRAALKEVDRND